MRIYVLAVCSTVFMLLVNGLANTGVIGGETMSSVAVKLSNLFVPAGFTFSIWGVIYLFQGIAMYRLFFQKKNASKLLVLLCIANLLNALWILLWLNLLVGFAWVMLMLLTVTLVYAVRYVRDSTTLGGPWLNAFLQIYAGWCAVACIANGAAFFVHSIGNFSPAVEQVAYVMVSSVGLIIGVKLANLAQTIFPLLPICWAFIGLASAHNSGGFLHITDYALVGMAGGFILFKWNKFRLLN